MTDQLYCPKCGPDWIGAYDMNHRCVECGEALKAEKVMERLKAVEEERDALLAHVERLTDAACSEGAGPMMRSAIDENPTTSLARLIAEKQAEALESFARGIRENNDEGLTADLYGMASLLDTRAQQLRRHSVEPRS